MSAPFEAATQEHAAELVSDIQDHGVDREPATAYEDWKAFADKAAEKPERSDDSAREKQPAKDGAPKESKAGSPEPKSDAKPESVEGKPEPQQQPPRTLQEAQRQANDRFLERAAKEEDFEGIVERMNSPYFPVSKDGFGRYNVLAAALTEISNSDAVLFELVKNKQIAYDLNTVPPGNIPAIVHKISAQIRFGIKARQQEAAPKPKPPKPPHEVGGRGAAHGDAAINAAEAGDFKSFSNEMSKRYRNSR
jgi:hypothetical protein